MNAVMNYMYIFLLGMQKYIDAVMHRENWCGCHDDAHSYSLA